MSLSDELLRMLARRVGVSPTWTDWDGSEKTASLDTLRGVLKALGYPSGSDGETRNTLAALDAGVAAASPQSRFVTARVGQAIVLPPSFGQGERLELEYEDGERRAVAPVEGLEGALSLPAPDRPGYHRIRGASEEYTVATAPERCFTFRDLSGGAAGWGLAAQIYSLPAGPSAASAISAAWPIWRGSRPSAAPIFWRSRRLTRSSPSRSASTAPIRPRRVSFSIPSTPISSWR